MSYLARNSADTCIKSVGHSRRLKRRNLTATDSSNLVRKPIVSQSLRKRFLANVVRLTSANIHLHNVRLSLGTPHDDLPADVQLFAQLVIDGNIFLQTLPVGSEDSRQSWTLNFYCRVSPHASTFSVMIIRKCPTQGIRLIGFVEMGREEVLKSVEQQKYLSLEFKKVNPDGPSLDFAADFSISESSKTESTSVNSIDVLQIPIVSLDCHLIRARLEGLYHSNDVQTRLDPLELWVMHERILLLPTSNGDRAKFLNILGDIWLKGYRKSQALGDLHQAVCAYNDAVRDDPEVAMYLMDLGNALSQRFDRGGDLADIDRSVLMFKEAVKTCPEGHPNRTSGLNNLATVLYHRFNVCGDIGDLNESILACTEAVRLSPDGDPGKAERLENFTVSLTRLSMHIVNLEDINESLFAMKEAVKLIPDGSTRASISSNLGASLQRVENMNKSIPMLRDAVRVYPDGHPGKLTMLNNLATILHHRFKLCGDIGDLNESILVLTEVVELCPDSHPKKPFVLGNLGKALTSRFRQLEALSDINEAISALEESVKLFPEGHPDTAECLDDLGYSLRLRFQRFDNLGDINKSVMMLENAIRLCPHSYPKRKTEIQVRLGDSLRCRFGRLDNIGDIHEAISVLKDALMLSPQHPPVLGTLATCLQERFGRLGNLSDISESVLLFKETVRLLPDHDPAMPIALNNLGNSLCSRFRHLNDLGDINEAISVLNKAVSLISDGHPNKIKYMQSLGISLGIRFEQLGDVGDITQSILLFRDAVAISLDDHPAKAWLLSNLSDCLGSRFQRLGDIEDLNESIQACRDAVKISPDDHPGYNCRYLHNLGKSLKQRFSRLGKISDINDAVLMFQQAVKISPDGHPDKPARLNSLGRSLMDRFRELNDVKDINESVLMLKEAVRLLPDEHPHKAGTLYNLCCSLRTRFDLLGDAADYEQLIPHCISAACSRTGPATARFDAAAMWATFGALSEKASLIRTNASAHAFLRDLGVVLRDDASVFWALHTKISGNPSLLDPYTVALSLLPELTWQGLSISDRHHRIWTAGRVVRDAAATAITYQKYDQAVEWLEQGHSIIWGQLLNLRTPINALKKTHPELANRLMFLSAQLEGAGTRNSSPQLESLDSTAQQYHEHAHMRDILLKKIRELDGFKRFLLPKTISELYPAAEQGPVVILNVSLLRCDALVLMPGLSDDEVLHIPLSSLTLEDAENLGESMGDLLRDGVRSERLTGQQEGYVPPETRFTHILSELWVRVVKPVLDGVGIMNPSMDNPQRIWWCPTGPLAFLPIHAAGLYGENETFGSKLSDFVISSYTPSLTALIEGFTTSGSQDELQLLAVAQPSATGQSYIPGTHDEINRIQALANGKVPVLRLEKDMATVSSVQNGMRDSRWVHFACHGVQDIYNPTHSALLLAGSSRMTLSDIIQLSLPHADLAFLSACQTATGAKDLQEESVHLAAGMLLAGYRGVIATMWSIADNDAPQVAADVYEHLFQTSPPDSNRAAEALHLAIMKLREGSGKKKSFFHWVPFIHVGV
ncbi:CHAT domain-containing protein [Mycena latifolia]|nr:CHAT domain-containing protein [Mycena latifolia]